MILKNYGPPKSKGPSPGYGIGAKSPGEPVAAAKKTAPPKGMKKGSMDKKTPSKKRKRP